MNRIEKAADDFRQGFACSQVVFAAFAGDLGIRREAALQIACGLGAGMGRSGQTCGAVTGAYLVLGARHGRFELENIKAREKTYALIREFNRQFQERHGSLQCTQLMGLDLGNPEDYQRAAAEGRFGSICVELVRTSVRILEEILEQPPRQFPQARESPPPPPSG